MIRGGAGNDVLRGGPQVPARENADQLGDGLSDGGPGNDIVLGGGAPDVILGGDGDEAMSGAPRAGGHAGSHPRPGASTTRLPHDAHG